MWDDRFEMSEAEALEVFRHTGVLRLAVATPKGPLLRTVDGVVHDGALCFHGGDQGEKLAMLGREVMVTTDHTVAHLPSWFFDERRACPATTYYRSVHLRGRAERVDEPAAKAAVLQALMERFQPEGGHQRIEAHDPLYASVVDKLLVVRVRPLSIQGKAKLGQHKGARTIAKALHGLWQRGAPGDLAALRIIREAHPQRPTPPWMRGPAGTLLEVAPDERELPGALALVEGEYWNVGVEASRIARAHLASSAWMVARDDLGQVVATARAMGDDAQAAWIHDVAVHPRYRGRGLGQALVGRLLDHPRVRGVRRVLLQTRDAQGFYATLGFMAHPPRHDTLALERVPTELGRPR
ncbi:MAG: GNAT family N-acetyltransferase [Myxococcales bacterium]|nr:GNAT family N-acetyltransferase [Myxococcales bacterium]